jgi:hypothetical protein
VSKPDLIEPAATSSAQWRLRLRLFSCLEEVLDRGSSRIPLIETSSLMDKNSVGPDQKPIGLGRLTASHKNVRGFPVTRRMRGSFAAATGAHWPAPSEGVLCHGRRQRRGSFRQLIPNAFAHNALERLIDVLYAVFELAVLDRQFFGDDVRASRNVWEREGLRSTVWLI